MSLIDYNLWDYHLEMEYKVCQVCDDGMPTSDCCGATFHEPGFPDNDICSECKEHAEPYNCDNCNGDVEVELCYDEILQLEYNDECNHADDFIKDQKESR